MDRYTVKPGGEIVPEPDIIKWALWFEKSGKTKFENGGRRVSETTLEDGTYVSTVFLGTDHRWGGGPPVLFETMIFDSEHEDFQNYQERYSTAEEARRGHDRIVLMVSRRNSRDLHQLQTQAHEDVPESGDVLESGERNLPQAPVQEPPGDGGGGVVNPGVDQTRKEEDE